MTANETEGVSPQESTDKPSKDGYFWSDYDMEVNDVTTSGGALAPLDPSVDLTITCAIGELVVFFTPEEAEQLADELQDSAHRARVEAGLVEVDSDG